MVGTESNDNNSIYYSFSRSLVYNLPSFLTFFLFFVNEMRDEELWNATELIHTYTHDWRDDDDERQLCVDYLVSTDFYGSFYSPVKLVVDGDCVSWNNMFSRNNHHNLSTLCFVVYVVGTSPGIFTQAQSRVQQCPMRFGFVFIVRRTSTGVWDI